MISGLTTCRFTDDDRLTPLMRERVNTGGRRIAATVLLVIVAFWSTALCLAGAASPHVSHACCAKQPSAQQVQIGAPRICCAEDTPNYDAAMPIAAGVLTPATFVIDASALLHDLAARSVRMARVDVDAGRPPGPPTYVLISTFRI